MQLKTMRVILETMENLRMSEIHVGKMSYLTMTSGKFRDIYTVTGKHGNITIIMRICDTDSKVESIIKTTEEKL